MTTVTIDLLNENAMALLRNLEVLKLIRLRREREEPKTHSKNFISKYKGAMSKQAIGDIDEQFKDLRNEWE
jgi:hypothetical protein